MRYLICITILLLLINCTTEKDKTNSKNVSKHDKYFTDNLNQLKAAKLKSSVREEVAKRSLDRLNMDSGHFTILKHKSDTSIRLIKSKSYDLNESITLFQIDWETRPTYTSLYSVGIYNIATDSILFDIYYQQTELIINVDSFYFENSKSLKLFGEKRLLQESKLKRKLIFETKI